MSDRLFLIDGHALIFKMYYAFAGRPMINSKGADMSILYGFTKYLLELEEREKPTHLAVAFDPPGGTFRNTMYPQYKANRKETPQLVIDALEPLQELCSALNIPVLMVSGYEADDVIGTVAKRFAGALTKVYMVTPDKDYGQLVDDNIFQLKPGKSGTEDVLLGREEICGKYGISSPEQVIEILTLCGDTADNVPGVKGVGEVGAKKLIATYGTVENIYGHLDELTERQRNMFREAEGHIALSHDLVTIRTDVPVDITLDRMKVDNSPSTEAADLFEKYEFRSLRHFLGDARPSGAKAVDLQTVTVSPSAVCLAAREAGIVSLIADYEGEGIFTGISRITASALKDGKYLCAEGSVEDFASIIRDKDTGKAGNDLKRLLNVLEYNGYSLQGKLWDIGLMDYLANPEKSHDPAILAETYLGITLDTPQEKDLSLFSQEEGDTHIREAAAYLALKEEIASSSESSASSLYDDMEEPLLKVLAWMERDGIKVDLGTLDEFAGELRKEIADHQARVRELSGEPDLNVASPKQIGELLFEKMKLDPKAKKGNRRAWATDEATLRAIGQKSPELINEILDFRAAKKLLSTYIEPFPSFVAKADGKVHTTFNQALTSTGRLSSSNPNLQNIPIRTQQGKNIRKAFVPGTPDGFIMSADYSQIELRIMAHLCADGHMTEAFRTGIDIHAATAATIFRVPVEEVTSRMRRIAKTANFGIMYGISAFGLAQNLGVSRSEAKELIDGYFNAFPSIRTFIDRTLEEARDKHYVETIFGRRRYLPDINSTNGNVRALAERNAVNAPIQGSAADIIKLAMIETGRRISAEGLASRMVLQIHDELLFDVRSGEEQRLKEIVVDTMENIIRLSVPLTVECNYGKNWLEAH